MSDETRSERPFWARRRTGRTRWAVVALTFACLVSGCEAEPAEPPRCTDPGTPPTAAPDLPLAYTTEHLDIHVASSVYMCAGTAEELERHVTAVASALGLEFDRRIPVYYGTVSECPNGVNGCVKPDGATFAQPHQGTLEHELAHAVACEIRSGAAPWLAEGWATSVEPSTEPVSKYMLPPSELLAVTRPEELSYESAGYFVRWLFERDSEVFRSLYEGIPSGLAVAEQDELFEAVYGLPFAELEAKFLDELPIRYIPFRQCEDLEELRWTGDEVIYTGEIDCAQAHTRGTPDAPLVLLMSRRFLIRVPQAGRYWVNVDGGIAGNLDRCGTEHPTTSEEQAIQFANHLVFSDINGAVEVDLEAGDWRLTIDAERGPPEPIFFYMWPADE